MLFRTRRKGFYTIVAVLLCFLYINWLVNISDWKQVNRYVKSEKRIENIRREDRLTIFEMFEAYDQDSSSSQINGRFVLMAAKNLINSNQNSKLIDNILTQTLQRLDSQELKSVFNLLYENNAFLLDKDLIETILEDKVYQISKQNVSSFDKINNYFSSNSYHILITFGVHLKDLKNLNEALINNLNTKCHLTQMSGSYSNLNILTSLYIECEGLTLQISIFYERASFYWIASDDHQIKDNTKIFGDRPRALNKFKISELVDSNSNKFYVPSDLKQYLFEYGHSKFLECNRDLAKYNLKKLGPSYNQDLKKNQIISPVIEHISKTLESFQKHYWLAGGTLLGWYRDCGIIPFTQDVDIAIWAHEYEPKIKKHFLGNKIIRLWGTLGLVNDSYEFRLFNDKFTFDLFLVYKHNDTHQWCGYQVKRYKFRRFMPKFDELCSGELLNNKFMVPCDPVKYLDKEYGPKNWHSPEAKNYTWSNVVFWSNWTDTDWPKTIKYYDHNGGLLNDKIIEYVNKFSSQNITQVPNDD